MFTKKIKHKFSKHREMLNCEKVGHFLLMISGVVVKLIQNGTLKFEI